MLKKRKSSKLTNKNHVKVLQIIETLGLGGAERLLATNLRFLDKEKFENVVVPLYSNKNNNLILEELSGVKIEKIFPRFKHDAWTIFKSLDRYIKKYNIDVIHTHAPLSDIYGRILGMVNGCRVFSTIHGVHYEAIMPLKGIKRLLLEVRLSIMRLIDKWTLKLSSGRLIAVSWFIKEYMIKKSIISSERAHLLYNSIDTEYFNNVDSEYVARKRKELGINDNDKVILTIGRNIVEKGQRYAIDAIKKLVSKRCNIKLIIVGLGPLRSELERYRDDLQLKDCIIFLGDEGDIRILLQMCDVFIFTSLYEGLGIAQIEAMAMKKPVVAFKIGPVPEVIDNGLNGILVTPGDSDGLAESMEYILNNSELGVKMGIEGRRIVEERFDIRKNIKLLEDLYLGIFNEKNE